MTIVNEMMEVLKKFPVWKDSIAKLILVDKRSDALHFSDSSEAEFNNACRDGITNPDIWSIVCTHLEHIAARAELFEGVSIEWPSRELHGALIPRPTPEEYKTLEDIEAPNKEEEEKWTPVVGEECEYYRPILEFFVKKTIIAKHIDGIHFIIATSISSNDLLMVEKSSLRPLKTERDKFIERGSVVIDSSIEEVGDDLGLLFDNGARFTGGEE